ncbi:hypothetical protein A7P25_14300 [Achromobacter xylosoxidans]|uniref:Uncharacterized protein n=2 Tax=Achromobacter TaxID=222 RepID=A0A2M9H2R6_9BURK|nr:hypothetical protein [Achromobacter ruhlandii]ALX85925.1 hypothetical protein APT56_23615 [Achromobacter denitrificans]AMG45090.1 hypothetical protein AL520_11685 [Achromobacter xylosoxidans]MCI1836111.1 hypothetical protein [Achromobacter ruhlandii]MCV6795027.1 hypothetical protein [Achromobacter ruhlandii]MCV6805917.1 hypothetical protein [Achromobacter ruhlandii]
MPSRLFRAAILPAAVLAAASAQASTPPYGVEVCTLTGTSGQYSVRVRNTGSAPLARAEVTGVRLDAGGQARDNITVSLGAIPPGRYETAILARHGESAALVSIATYQSVNGAETRQEELFAGKVAHVSPGSALQYTLAPLAVRGWTVAYGGPNAPTLAPGSAVLLAYPARSGKKLDTRPEAGRAPAMVTPLKPCPVPRGH